ncbi:RILP-like protein 1 isoform X2 [Lineus longissimus]|uniref:RILP-like protein 1 isoform X2 n=1 Tax=Lineus longissimus TaxID=88925 RepID=UPI00315DA900
MLSPSDPYIFRLGNRPEMGDSPQNMSVVDVYDLASNIGKEFEVIIDTYGVDAVTSLMPKVIRALENLEILANDNERENNEISELKFAVQKLEREKAAKAEDRMRYEVELEQIEETWRAESKDLLTMVAKLQEENRRLNSALSESEQTAAKYESKEDEFKIMTKLKESVDRHRDQIRALKRENTQKNVDIDALTAQLERIAKVNAEIRRKQTVTAKQARVLITEKADLQTALQDKEQQIQKIKEHLDKECVESPSSTAPTSPEADYERLEERLHHEGKMVIDLKDPNRPRFTLNELREVLLERNELKTKLIEVEDELSVYKPKEEEEDPPVQGPINKEPYEKLYPDLVRQEESGIRKFFRNLFGSSPKTKKTKSPMNKPQSASQPSSRRSSNASIISSCSATSAAAGSPSLSPMII